MFVRKFPRHLTISLLSVALFLASCGGGATAVPTADVNAISTAAVETAIAQLSLQFTQTAQAAPTSTTLPTNTPISLPTTAAGSPAPTTAGGLPTVSFNTTPLTGITQLASPAAPPAATVSLGDACNNSIYLADLTIPDGTEIRPGVDFKKVWSFQNTGTCTWDEGYSLVFIGGDQAIDPVNYDITVREDFIGPGETAEFDIPLTAPLTEGAYTGAWRMRSDSGVYFGETFTVNFVVKR